MSYLREQIVEILSKEGWTLYPDDIWPAVGFYRKHMADVYRWQFQALPPGSPYKDKRGFGCWQTMTEFVKLAKKYGFYYMDSEDQEIGAHTHTKLTEAKGDNK